MSIEQICSIGPACQLGIFEERVRRARRDNNSSTCCNLYNVIYYIGEYTVVYETRFFELYTARETDKSCKPFKYNVCYDY